MNVIRKDYTVKSIKDYLVKDVRNFILHRPLTNKSARIAVEVMKDMSKDKMICSMCKVHNANETGFNGSICDTCYEAMSY